MDPQGLSLHQYNLIFGVLLLESMGDDTCANPVMVTSDVEANIIKICAEEIILVTTRPSENAAVECFDKDPNFDDIMAEGFTGKDGCVTMKYKHQSWDDLGGRRPDIYCTVNKVGFVQACPASKDQHEQAKVADIGTMTFYRDRIGDYGHDNGCGPAFTERL